MTSTHEAASKKGTTPPSSYDYSKLIEGLPAAIYTCDTEGRITFFNEAAAALWGRRPEIGQDLWCGSWKIYHTDGSPMTLDECPMAITLKENRPVYGEEIIIERQDGMRRNVLPHPKPIFDTDGKMCGAVNMLIDVTDKREREQLLHVSEEKYRLLSESLEKRIEKRRHLLKDSEERYYKMIEEVQDYAILLLDEKGNILNWNQGAEKIKGYTEEEIIGKNFRIFYLEEDRKNMLPEYLISEAAKTGRAMHEGWRIRKDGTQFWGSIVITALHDENGAVIGFSKVTRDLTQKKVAEDQLTAYAKELESRNKELEQYVYIASHDLQEPLRKIQTFADLLEKNIDDKLKVKKNLEKIHSSAGRMSVLIKGVLRYSKLSKTDELFVPTDLNEVLKNVKEDLELLIEEKGTTIIHPELPVLKCIPIQLHQLFSNLISNAVKFADKEPLIEITAEKLHNGAAKKYPQLSTNYDYLKLVFKDNGIGFDEQYSEQVFKLFKQLHENKYGTGIGLAICKKIVENHNGYISVTSVPNTGTAFDIFLPMI